MTLDLPTGLKPYKRTPTFTEATIPDGLLKDHSTKDGVWGLIQIEEGKLRYVVSDPRRDASERILTANEAAAIIEPTIVHHVEPLGPVRFHVEFLKLLAG